MRKRCRRQIRPTCAPTMVAMFNHPKALLAERTALEGLREGWAESRQFNVLLDCKQALRFAAERKGDREALNIATLAAHVLHALRERYAAGQALQATPDELDALILLVDYSDDWWARQSGALFAWAYAAVETARANQ